MECKVLKSKNCHLSFGLQHTYLLISNALPSSPNFFRIPILKIDKVLQITYKNVVLLDAYCISLLSLGKAAVKISRSY